MFVTLFCFVFLGLYKYSAEFQTPDFIKAATSAVLDSLRTGRDSNSQTELTDENEKNAERKFKNFKTHFGTAGLNPSIVPYESIPNLPSYLEVPCVKNRSCWYLESFLVCGTILGITVVF